MPLMNICNIQSGSVSGWGLISGKIHDVQQNYDLLEVHTIDMNTPGFFYVQFDGFITAEKMMNLPPQLRTCRYR
jgi:hypothetical protein